ncbi:MAG: AAA domain-containing protein [Tannerellaceae bacterium]|nr:AAA domain-containing protein [Tannerellaceae bacterium]
MKKLLDEKFEEQGKEERRKELAEEIASETPYSHRWFEIYLEYLATFEETVDTFVQKSISFQQITLFVNAKGVVSANYFLLKGASKIIPVSLESYTDFEIELSFGPKKKVKIKVESVSKKGQDLLVFCPGGIDEKIKDDFDNVKSVAIYFRPGVELIKKLQSEFSILEPWEDILADTQPLYFVYGPPGTGKTTVLSHYLIRESLNNPEGKALVLTPTNKAGDVLAGKILKESPSTKVIRLSPATDPALDECIYRSSINEEVLEHTNILISTIHRLPYTQVELLSDEFLKLYDVDWDYVIFDESSMISLPYFVFALQAVKRNNPDAIIIIAGDPKQIPPIVEATDKQLEEMDLSDISIYTIFNVQDFNKPSKGRKCDKVTYLDTQYRSVKEIGQLFSNFSYGGKIKHGRDMALKPRKKLPAKFPASLKKPVVFIDVPVEDDNSITLPKKLFYSSYHIYSALFVTELVKNLAGKMNGEEFLRIGIISPYKAQAVIMGKLVTYLDIPYNLDVRCDTIHGFQGDECDIIIYVVNPNNKSFTNNDRSLINKEYIYNVAISRAQDYLWIINPFVTGNPHVEGLKEDAFSIMKGGEIVDCQKLEKYFLKSENFITRNSYMTGHDNVNIFGFAEDMSYYIKAGENTIDIQLKK